jgi:hypothetical protein
MGATVRTDPRSFVRSAVIAPPPVSRGGAGAAPADQPAIGTLLETGKDQAAVVGSDIIAFVTGVTAERREAIINSSLLAQLVANHQVQDRTRVYEWYDAYFRVLANIGWAIQQVSWAEYKEQQGGFQAHEAILKVATTLLGPATTALALVTTTIDALKSMDQNDPWVTLFNRESQEAKTAHFQVALAEQAPDGQFLVTTMAFGLEAKSTVTQVLFFKVRKGQATLKHHRGQVTINTAVLDQVRDDLSTKLKNHAEAYVRALPDFA